MTHQVIGQFLLLFFLLILSAFFSGAEAAIFSLSKLEKRRLQTQHPSIWETISRLLEKPRRTLITILIGNMVVNTMASALATMLAVRWFGDVGVAWTICIFSFILVMVGELTPKIFAVRHDEWFSRMSARPLDILARVLFPIRWLVRRVADLFLSFLVKDQGKEVDLMSENELKALVRIGEEEGALKAEEGQMIQRLFGLGERIAREIMTPRTDLVAFDIEQGRDKLIELVRKSHFSYLPVYEKSLDNLLGVISTQEFVLDTQNRFRELIVPSEYVPETKHVDELLEDFRSQGRKFAICVDEYGSVSGLITLEDILEEVFGEFYDEYSKEETLIKALGHDRFLVHAKIGLHELGQELEIHLKSETSETLNGWLLEQMGRIPKLNESYRFESFEFIIREVFRRRIIKVEIHRKS